MKNLKRDFKIELIALIIFSTLALWPFFKHGYFESHDGEWMVIRFTAFHQALRAGQFPVRFADRLNNNYGYPVTNYLYPLPFYLAELPKALKVGYVDSIKIVFVLSTFSSVILMYLALSQKFSKEASLAGSIIYLFAPYRFVDLYVRGSIGENLAFSFIPLILLSIFKLQKNKFVFLSILSLAVAGLITSHNIMAAIFLPVFIITILILLKGKILLQSFGAILLGVLISAFFIIPAIYDLQFVQFQQTLISDPIKHLIPVLNLVYSKWGYGATPTEENGFSAQIGILSIIIITAALFTLIKRRQKDYLSTFLLVAIFISALLISNLSSIFWEIFPFVNIIQFPWRLLSLVVFAVAILTAPVIDQFKSKFFVTAAIIVLAVLSTITFTKPSKFVNRGDSFYSTNEGTTTVLDEYLPTWAQLKPGARSQDKILPGLFSISDQQIKPANYRITVNAIQDTRIQIGTIFFPGFVAKIDNKTVPITYDNPAGLMNIQLPKGEHEVIIKYSKTPVHLISEIVSIIAVILTGLLFFYSWQKKLIF